MNKASMSLHGLQMATFLLLHQTIRQRESGVWNLCILRSAYVRKTCRYGAIIHDGDVRNHNADCTLSYFNYHHICSPSAQYHHHHMPDSDPGNLPLLPVCSNAEQEVALCLMYLLGNRKRKTSRSLWYSTERISACGRERRHNFSKGKQTTSFLVIRHSYLPKPQVWRSWIPYVYPTMKGDPWEPLKDGIGKFDKEMCDAWNGELDTILTFVSQPGRIFAVIDQCIRPVYSLPHSQHSASSLSNVYPKAQKTLPTSSC